MKVAFNFKIIILEDDDFYNRFLTSYLTKNLEELGIIKGFTVSISSFTSFNDCSLNLTNDVDILFSDYYLNDGFNAPSIMNKLKKDGINCKVIILSRLNCLQTSLAPLLEGAADFVQKNNKAMQRCLHISEAIISEKMKLIN